MTLDAAPADPPLVFISAFAAGETGAIHVLQWDGANGSLKPLHRATGVAHPFFIALSPDRRFLYSIHARNFGGEEHEQVAAYKIERTSGRLTLLNRQSSRGSASCYLEVDATGRTLLVANYASGSVAALPVRRDGSLGEAASFIQHAGSSVDPERQKGPNAHCIALSPDNRFALAADLGIDQVRCYRLDAPAAKLSLNSPHPFAPAPPGAGPRHLTFHPNGKRVYVINELKNSVTWFDYQPESGRLTERQTISSLPEGFAGQSACADVKITPDGRFLYGTNRGHDSIAIFRIGQDGRLTRIGLEPSRGQGPQNLLITPDGKWLLCANMPANHVVVFRIDLPTGGLKPVGDPVALPMPACIRFVP